MIRSPEAIRITRQQIGLRPVRALALALAIAALSPASSLSQQIFLPRIDIETIPSPFAVATGDINTDGKADFVSVSDDSGGMCVHLGVGDGTFLPRITSYGPGGVWDVAVGDLDGDAYPDIGMPGSQSSFLLYHGAGDGTFPVIEEIYTNKDRVFYSTLGDFNGDTVDDIAMSHSLLTTGAVSIFLSDGAGGFTGPVEYPATPGPQKIIAVDLNHDQKLDLVTANYGEFGEQNSISVFLGQGDGTFDPKTDYGTATSPIGATAGYFDGDTNIDVAVCTANGEVSVLMGDGLGGFAAPTNYNIGFVLVWISSADVNGDTLPDLLVTDNLGADTPGELHVLLNDGLGGFVEQDTYQTGAQVNSVACADFNGDTKWDAIVSSGAYHDYPYPFERYASLFVSCAPCTPTAVAVTLEEISAVDGVVRARWSLPSGSIVFAAVQRKADGEDWINLEQGIRIDRTPFEYTDGTVTPGRRYGYRLFLRDETDIWYTDEGWVFVPAVESAPLRLSLRNPYPNPARGEVRLRFGQPTEGPSRLRVFDVQGREIARLHDGRGLAGWRDMTWDGRRASGRVAPSGVYFAVLEQGREVVRKKFVLAR